MLWYIKLTLYLIGMLFAFFALAQVEWAKIIRLSRRELAIFVYIIISIALGALIGFFLIQIGEIFISINQ